MTRELLVSACTVEALEDVRSLFGRNSASIISDTDFDSVGAFTGENSERTPRPVILNGVLDEILQRKLDHVPIAFEREPVRHRCLDLEIRFFSEDARILETTFQQSAQIGGLF